MTAKQFQTSAIHASLFLTILYTSSKKSNKANTNTTQSRRLQKNMSEDCRKSETRIDILGVTTTFEGPISKRIDTVQYKDSPGKNAVKSRKTPRVDPSWSDPGGLEL